MNIEKVKFRNFTLKVKNGNSFDLTFSQQFARFSIC